MAPATADALLLAPGDIEVKFITSETRESISQLIIATRLGSNVPR